MAICGVLLSSSAPAFYSPECSILRLRQDADFLKNRARIALACQLLKIAGAILRPPANEPDINPQHLPANIRSGELSFAIGGGRAIRFILPANFDRHPDD